MKNLTTALLACSVLLSACATIVSNGKQSITVESRPEGARVLLDGMVLGTTPAVVTVPRRKGGLVLTVEKDGYAKGTVIPGTDLDPMFWGNIVFGGLIGSTVDSASGGSVRYAPDRYFIELEPSGVGGFRQNSYRAVTQTDDQRLREFVLITYGSIQQNLAAGRGEHLDALLIMLQAEAKDRYEVIRKIDAISTLAGNNILRFADMLVEFRSERMTTRPLQPTTQVTTPDSMQQRNLDNRTSKPAATPAPLRPPMM